MSKLNISGESPQTTYRGGALAPIANPILITPSP